jgi:hypothetical protein
MLFMRAAFGLRVFFAGINRPPNPICELART